MSKKPNHLRPIYRLIKWAVRVVYPGIRLTGTEHLPEEPVIFVGNHSQMHGPIVCELYMPVERWTWCAGEMMRLREVPEYAFRDFWSQKPGWTHGFYRVLSYLIAPLSVVVFGNANTIAVYHDSRIMSTFKRTVEVLAQGQSVVIFPEHDQKHNHIVYDFQDRFIDVAKLCYRKTGRPVAFVPMYLAPSLRLLTFGEPVRFDPEAPMAEERVRIKTELMDRITGLARALPPHTVVPYRNIPKKDYPKNTDA